MLKAIACKILPVDVRRALRRWLRRGRDVQQAVPISYGYEVIDGGVSSELLRGWRNPAVAERQFTAFVPHLQKMREGKPREDFLAVANAVQMTELQNPLIIEVGCGSGWNSEVLTYLFKKPFRYIGVDISLEMTNLGRRCYSNLRFVTGDAIALPFKDSSCDILLSGTVLMHLVGYHRAVQESRRVTQKYCIFHTIPILRHRKTVLLSKFAYGAKVAEVIFNEDELFHIISTNGLVLREKFDSIPYNLEHILGEPTYSQTYLCEIK